ncbi:CoA-binding protein [Clostridium aminobutyricum]|uniref:CoA-binding protein n=1 Tax=Clostridium aminobutyricum TaxID=33953 RepID=A0A939D8S1_CLOAM|nr:CoA-binding protein [Clostridium aminobutyricum]MBN7772803.1 CoA-binding protein [Clostridium aminobutyricum]
MDLRETMRQKTFAVVGDTLNEDKYAYKIKKQMEGAGYKVYCVGKELQSINDIPEDIDVIDLCINPVKGLQLMKECEKNFNNVVIQPGAESPELLDYLRQKNLPFIESCLLVGLSVYMCN